MEVLSPKRSSNYWIARETTDSPLLRLMKTEGYLNLTSLNIWILRSKIRDIYRLKLRQET